MSITPPKVRSQGGEDLQKLNNTCRFYWPGHWRSVQEWCRTCPVCAQHKTPIPKNLAPLQSLTFSSPMQIVVIDILGPLPLTRIGKNYSKVPKISTHTPSTPNTERLVTENVSSNLFSISGNEMVLMHDYEKGYMKAIAITEIWMFKHEPFLHNPQPINNHHCSQMRCFAVLFYPKIFEVLNNCVSFYRLIRHGQHHTIHNLMAW